MSLDKAVASGQEHRKRHLTHGRCEVGCRPGCDCLYCQTYSRRHPDAARQQSADEQVREWQRQQAIRDDNQITADNIWYDEHNQGYSAIPNQEIASHKATQEPEKVIMAAIKGPTHRRRAEIK